MNVVDYIYENYESFTPKDWSQWTATVFDDLNSSYPSQNVKKLILDFEDRWDTKQIAAFDWSKVFCFLDAYHELFSKFSDLIDWDAVSHTDRWYMSTMNEILPCLDEFADRLDLDYLQRKHDGIPKDFAMKHFDKFKIETLLGEYGFTLDEYVQYKDYINWEDKYRYRSMPSLTLEHYLQLKDKANIELWLEEGTVEEEVLRAIKDEINPQVLTKVIPNYSVELISELAAYIDWENFDYQGYREYVDKVESVVRTNEKYMTNSSWEKISDNQRSVEFIRQYESKLNFTSLLKHNDWIPPELLIKHVNEIEWSKLSLCKFDESVLNECFNEIGSQWISKKGDLSEEFIVKHQDELDLNEIVKRQHNISENTLLTLKDKIDSPIFYSQPLSPKYILSQIDKCSPEEIRIIAINQRSNEYVDMSKLNDAISSNIKYFSATDCTKALHNGHGLSEQSLRYVIENNNNTTHFSTWCEDSSYGEFWTAVSKSYLSKDLKLSSAFLNEYKDDLKRYLPAKCFEQEKEINTER